DDLVTGVQTCALPIFGVPLGWRQGEGDDRDRGNHADHEGRELPPAPGAWLGRGLLLGLRGQDWDPLEVRDDVLDVRRPWKPVDQIGRASCREGVEMVG